MVFATATLFGQATPNAPFQIRVQVGAAVSVLENGGTITLAAAGLGQTTSATLTFTNTGSAAATIPERPRIIGSADFTISSQPEFPMVLQPAQMLTLQAQFRPATSARLTGQIALPYTIASGSTTPAGNLIVNLVGVSPDPVFAYVPPEGNVTAVSPSGTMQFPVTVAGSSSSITVIVVNRGSASLTVESVDSTGQGYTVSGLPLFPAVVEAGRDVRFNVRFAPVQAGDVRGQLTVGLGGRTVGFALQGTAVAAQFSYEIIRDNTAEPLVPAQTIVFAGTRTGSSSRLVVRFRNTGMAEGRINAITASGSGYQVADLPALPLTLLPGRSAEATVVFAPTQPGRLTGRLRIGDDSFELSGTSLGAQLTYGYGVGNTSATVSPGGSVLFPATDVGRSATTRLTISNTGTVSTTISSVGLGSTSSVFSVAELPQLPATINPGEEVSFLLLFAPNTTGSASASLRIDADSFTLAGISNGVVPVPAYRLEMLDAIQPMSQPAITLTLQQPYALPLNGTLTISGDSDAQPADPAVQFATGGRTVNFRIPANSTQAVFNASGPQTRMQTGTVAGTLRLTPGFTTESGLTVTPGDSQPLRIEISESAPKLISVQTTTTDTGLSVQFTGFVTGKTIRQVEFQFVVAGSVTANETRFTVNVDNAFSAWYQSAQSRQFGSQFTATMPFSLQLTGSTAPPAQSVQSVSVRLLNDRGSSETMTASVAGR